MQWRNSPDRYGAGLVIIHWLTVVLIVVAWLLGQFEDDFPKDWHRATQWLHNNAGLLVLLLLAARLALRLADPVPPPEPTRFGALGLWLAKIAHGALYLLVLAVPIVGIVVVFGRGQSLNILGLVDIASPWARDRDFARSVREVHEWLANGLMVLAFLHAAAALVHHFILHDRTLRRMLPHRAG